MTAVISSARLDLVELPPEILKRIEAADLLGIEALLGVPVPAHWPETIPAERRLHQLAAFPEEQRWLTRAIILRAERVLVGIAGFHGFPDDEGRVVVGYEVLPEHRRRGYAREAVITLENWAFSTGEARIAVATISPTNQHSLTLVKSLGFKRVGRQIDEEDGLELIFERELPLSEAVSR